MARAGIRTRDEKKAAPVVRGGSALVPEAGIEPARLAAGDFLPTSAFAAAAPIEAAFVGWSTPSP